jgi:hypothetical protein
MSEVVFPCSLREQGLDNPTIIKITMVCQDNRIIEDELEFISRVD